MTFVYDLPDDEFNTFMIWVRQSIYFGAAINGESIRTAINGESIRTAIYLMALCGYDIDRAAKSVKGDVRQFDVKEGVKYIAGLARTPHVTPELLTRYYYKKVYLREMAAGEGI